MSRHATAFRPPEASPGVGDAFQPIIVGTQKARQGCNSYGAAEDGEEDGAGLPSAHLASDAMQIS
jgi:hypothetical protein